MEALLKQNRQVVITEKLIKATAGSNGGATKAMELLLKQYRKMFDSPLGTNYENFSKLSFQQGAKAN